MGDSIILKRKVYGKKLKEIREFRGLSQNQLSKLTGIPGTSISKIESGEWSMSMDLILRLAKHLNFKIDFTPTD